MRRNSMIGDKAWRKSMRANINQQRRQLPAERIHAASVAVFDRVLQHPFLQQPRVIGSYMSFRGEIDTQRLNEALLKAHHTMCLPVIVPEQKGMMNFYTYKEQSELVANSFNILEPVPHEETYTSPEVIEVLLVPLVGFNLEGDRLGMGGGYYDRMLKKISCTTLCIGLAYDFQQIDNLVRHNWDMPLDEIITPTRHIICNTKY